MMTFGMYLRTARRRAGFPRQIQLAQASGVSQATISRLENEIQQPNTETLTALSIPLKLSLMELMQAAGYENNSSLTDRGEYDELKAENSRLRQQVVHLKEAIQSLTKGW